MNAYKEFDRLAIPLSRLYSDWYLVQYDYVYGCQAGNCIVSGYDLEKCTKFPGYLESFYIDGHFAVVHEKHILTEEEFYECLSNDREVYQSFIVMYMPCRIYGCGTRVGGNNEST